MNFKKAKWVEWENDCSVANMVFGVHLTVYENEGEWLWQMDNEDFTLERGKSKSKAMAKIMAERAFHQYVIENLEKCTK